MLNREIESLLQIVSREQKEDGSFVSLSSTSPSVLRDVKEYHTTFFSSLILSSLSNVSSAQGIKEKIKNFLLSEKNADSTFNYWKKNSKEFKALPYPNDLDDTFCAWSGLTLQEGSVSGEDLARLVMLLSSQEIQEGGPYYTWVNPPNDPVWKDVDLAVNSNIAYFLQLQKVELPNLNRFFEQKIQEKDYSSPYYPSVYPVIYFLSRAYSGSMKNKVVEYLLSKRVGNSWGNILYDALAVNSLLNLGYSEIGIDLVSRISEIENFFAFCMDPKIDSKTYYGGSKALTAALVIEALARTGTNNEEPLRDSFFEKVLERAKTLNLGKHLEEIQKRPDDVYTTILPNILNEQINKPVSEEKVLSLGLYNFLGCIGYRVNDDLEDNHEVSESAVAVRQKCFYEMESILKNLGNSRVEIFANQVLDKMRSVQDWEKENCRNIDKLPSFGDMSVLADKSLGYVIAPVGILYLSGLANENRVNTLVEFFKNYIIARQLNDDAHDWEEDLSKGHINYPASLVFKKNSNKNQEELREIFWKEVVPEIAITILNFTSKAEKNLQQIDFLRDTDFLERLLVPARNAAKTILSEYKKTNDFLNVYKGI